jgi:hypothetical protein
LFRLQDDPDYTPDDEDDDEDDPHDDDDDDDEDDEDDEDDDEEVETWQVGSDPTPTPVRPRVVGCPSLTSGTELLD